MTRNKHEKIRFGLVGVVNTGLDFGILFLLHSLGLTSVVANYISTSIAFVFSFSANRKFTFRSSGNIKRELTLFLFFTLIGLWVIQPIVLLITEPMLRSMHLEDWISLLGAKFIATCVSLIWNYLWYSRVVFKNRENSHE